MTNTKVYQSFHNDKKVEEHCVMKTFWCFFSILCDLLKLELHTFYFFGSKKILRCEEKIPDVNHEVTIWSSNSNSKQNPTIPFLTPFLSFASVLFLCFTKIE